MLSQIRKIFSTHLSINRTEIHAHCLIFPKGDEVKIEFGPFQENRGVHVMKIGHHRDHCMAGTSNEYHLRAAYHVQQSAIAVRVDMRSGVRTLCRHDQEGIQLGRGRFFCEPASRQFCRMEQGGDQTTGIVGTSSIRHHAKRGSGSK